MNIVVLIPPMQIIGRVDAGSPDEVIGKPVVLEYPAAMVFDRERGPSGPVNVIKYAALGPRYYLPATSPWPWRQPTRDEEDGYERLKARGAGIVVPDLKLSPQ